MFFQKYYFWNHLLGLCFLNLVDLDDLYFVVVIIDLELVVLFSFLEPCVDLPDFDYDVPFLLENVGVDVSE